MSTPKDIQRQLREFQEQAELWKRESERLRRENEEVKARAEKEKARADESKVQADEERARADERDTLVAKEKRRADEEKKRADEEKRRADEAKVRADEEKAQADEAKVRAYEERARADESNIQAAKEKKRANEEKRRADEAKTRADILERRQGPTQFLDYIRSIEQHLYTTFTIEPDPKKLSTFSTTSVRGKFYPQHFQPWTDFTTIHNAIFDSFTTAFADKAYFPPLYYIESIGEDLSPKVADESGLLPFVRASIEKPAATVVSRYLEITGHNKFKAVKFHGSAYGIMLTGKSPLEQPAEGLSEPARKRRHPIIDIGVPDRYLRAYSSEGKVEYALVGEIKPAHALNGVKVNRVLSAPPGDDFFLRATRQDATASTSSRVPGEVYVAKALSQAFHYMITLGLEFGYVASGDSLIFLRVPEEDPNTLYYFGSVFPVDHNQDVAAAREPRETALAHLATLCMLSIESTRRSNSWIDAREDDLKRWPQSKVTVRSLAEMPPPLLPDNGRSGDGGGGGSAGGSAGGGESGHGAQSALKRPHSPGSRSSTTTGGNTTGAHGARQARLKGPSAVEPPTLPYCTQACLSNLCRGRTLDRNCPNAELHQAAASSKDGHALTAGEVRTRVVAQLAENMDKDCKSFLFDGIFGRYGVLFKITVTGFGYTFVAKAVQAVHRRILQHETAIYTALEEFQGRLIPVCLGLADLERPIPLRNCQHVSHMMLMSYVGGNFFSRNVFPGVNLDVEAEKTRKELYAAGLLNEDDNEANFAWNEEVLRVMEFDFDEAYIEPMTESPAAPGASPQRAKRYLSAYHEEDVQIRKRARTAA